MPGPDLAAPVMLALVAALAVLAWPHASRRQWLPANGHRRTALAGQDLAGGGDGRQADVTQLVPEALELMALALLGGGSVAGAARSVALTLPTPLSEELGQVGAALLAGDDPESAWNAAGEHWAPGRQSLDLAQRAGVPPRDALIQVAGDLRKDAVADVEVAAARLGVLLVIPLGLAYLPAFVLTTVVPVVVALMRDLTW